jgi:hypothetical protein
MLIGFKPFNKNYRLFTFFLVTFLDFLAVFLFLELDGLARAA